MYNLIIYYSTFHFIVVYSYKFTKYLLMDHITPTLLSYTMSTSKSLYNRLKPKNIQNDWILIDYKSIEL